MGYLPCLLGFYIFVLLYEQRTVLLLVYAADLPSRWIFTERNSELLHVTVYILGLLTIIGLILCCVLRGYV